MEIKPISYFLLKKGEEEEIAQLFSFLKGSCNLANVTTIYTKPETFLLNFCRSICNDVRLTFYHLKQLASYYLHPELSTIILQIALMKNNEVIQYLNTLKSTQPDSHVLTFYENHLSPNHFVFWNISEDINFHKISFEKFISYNFPSIE